MNPPWSCTPGRAGCREVAWKERDKNAIAKVIQTTFTFLQEPTEEELKEILHIIDTLRKLIINEIITTLKVNRVDGMSS